SLIAENTFRFLNHESRVEAAADWNDPAQEKLWLYNLHYFDDLNADNAAERKGRHEELLQRWIAENPPATGHGWDPYPTSLRIVNWIKWFLVGNRPPAGTLKSLASQATWLRNRLEYHLLGNHLLANSKALIFAGTFFEGTAPDGWRSKGSPLFD